MPKCRNCGENHRLASDLCGDYCVSCYDGEAIEEARLLKKKAKLAENKSKNSV